jgi:formylglycine-generating enzyme required for sulfatase activity
MRTCVTNELYGHYAPEHVAGLAPQLPVTNVSWFDAVIFCDWIGGRLPTEAEWEFVSRQAGPEVAENLPEYAWFSHNSADRLHPVGTRKSHPSGMYDMFGNVWEWCHDTYDSDYYAVSPVAGPVNAAAHGNRVCRGGAMNSFRDMCRPAYRHHEPADYWSSDIGFRIAADLPRHHENHGRTVTGR